MRTAFAASVLAIASCGRIGFDPLGARADAGAADAAGDAQPPADAAPCAFGPWAAPQTDVALDSATTDWGPTLSHDKLTLLFASSRDGGTDKIFAATRSAVGSAWSAPVELPSAEPGGDPSMSADELTLYWGGGGVYSTTRASTTDAWTGGSAIPNLDDATHTVEGGPDIAADGLTLVYTGTASADGLWHMYQATRATPTDAWSGEAPVPGLATTHGEAYGSMRGDLLEVMYQDETGVPQLWSATRASASDPFGSAALVTVLNSGAYQEGDADLSDDGTEAWFASEQPGGVGGWDLWYSTRSCQ